MNINKKKILQAFLGFLSSMLLWAVGILVAGEIYAGDLYSFSDGIPFLKKVFPLLFILYGIAVAVFCHKKNMKIFLIASQLTLVIPVISRLLLGAILQIGPSFLILIFMYLYMPFSSLISSAGYIYEDMPFLLMTVPYLTVVFELLCSVLLYKYLQIKKTRMA